MFVGQETSEIDGIEHKPLKITGDADKVEVRVKEEMKTIGIGLQNLLFNFSVLNNMSLIP